MDERHASVLAELAELGLSLARDLHARALAAETPEEACDLGLAFQRVSRAVRQTVMLEAKLQKERRAMAREDAAAEAKARETRVRERKAQVRYALRREVLEACDSDEEEEDLLGDLEERLDALTADEFESATLDDLIARLREEFFEAAPEQEGQASPAPDGGNPGVIHASNPTGHASGPKLIQMPHGGWAPTSNSS